MAAAKPVVAARAEGVVELLGNAAREQTVEVGQWGKFSLRVVETILDQSLGTRLGIQNQARAQEFSFDLMIEACGDLYLSLSNT